MTGRPLNLVFSKKNRNALGTQTTKASVSQVFQVLRNYFSCFHLTLKNFELGISIKLDYELDIFYRSPTESIITQFESK